MRSLHAPDTSFAYVGSPSGLSNNDSKLLSSSAITASRIDPDFFPRGSSDLVITSLPSSLLEIAILNAGLHAQFWRFIRTARASERLER
jgi:hypothetical protein